MDERLKEIAEDFDRFSIGIDDSFNFKCRSCGKCCRNRHDILLNPRDLFRISMHLELLPRDVVAKYCETYIGPDSRIPIVRLLPVGGNNRCPFLVDKRCQVHPVKPAVCALFPLGRVLKSPESDMVPGVEPMTMQYIINPVDCGAKRKQQTVREWLDKWGYEHPDDYFVKWNTVMMDFSSLIRMMESQEAAEKALKILWDFVYYHAYINYRTGSEFMPQFDENLAQIAAIVAEGRKAAGSILQTDE